MPQFEGQHTEMSSAAALKEPATAKFMIIWEAQNLQDAFKKSLSILERELASEGWLSKRLMPDSIPLLGEHSRVSTARYLRKLGEEARAENAWLKLADKDFALFERKLKQERNLSLPKYLEFLKDRSHELIKNEGALSRHSAFIDYSGMITDLLPFMAMGLLLKRPLSNLRFPTFPAFQGLGQKGGKLPPFEDESWRVLARYFSLMERARLSSEAACRALGKFIGQHAATAKQFADDHDEFANWLPSDRIVRNEIPSVAEKIGETLKLAREFDRARGIASLKRHIDNLTTIHGLLAEAARNPSSDPLRLKSFDALVKGIEELQLFRAVLVEETLQQSPLCSALRHSPTLFLRAFRNAPTNLNTPGGLSGKDLQEQLRVLEKIADRIKTRSLASYLRELGNMDPRDRSSSSGQNFLWRFENAIQTLSTFFVTKNN